MTALLPDPRCPPCEFKHPAHLTKLLSVQLHGQLLPDLPSFLLPHTLDFLFYVYDWTAYQTESPGFCAGRDELSKSIDLQGVWEGFETLLTISLLRPGDNFLDFGAHVGWYSRIAAELGATTDAYECNSENLRLLYLNTQRQLPGKVHIHPGWVSAHTSLAPTDWLSGIRLIKMDMESWENEIVDACERIIRARIPEYILMEVSPIFAPHYPDTVARVLGHGYDCYLIPGAQEHDLADFSRDPLAAVLTHPFTVADISTITQRNVLFVRADR